MSLTSRTNLLHGHLFNLITLKHECVSPELALTGELSFILVMEQALCVLLHEVTENNSANLSGLSLEAELDIIAQRDSNAWVVKVFRNAINDSSHWLSQWNLARKRCLQLPAVSEHNRDSPPSQLIKINNEAIEDECSKWLEGYSQLVAECRSYSINN